MIVDSKETLNLRDTKFDVLRFMGLLCIILAHTNPPGILYQLRNFDVPLMVIISGAVFGISASNKQLPYLKYAKKRFVRLVSPTWTFLFFYFSVVYLFCVIVGISHPFSEKDIFLSFSFISGYFWIIRVFLLMALIAPFLFEFNKKVKSNRFFLETIIFIYLIYEIFNYFYVGTGIYIVDIVIEYFLLYLFSYGCLFALGLRLSNMTKNDINLLLGIFFILFLGLFMLNYSTSFLPTEQYKYPPRIYYLSYAIFISLFLYSLLNTNINKIFNNNLVFFVSSSSLWIYLWHIMFLSLWNYSVNIMPLWANNFAFMFIVVFSLSIMVTFIQTKIFRKISLWNINYRYKNIIKIVFLK